MSEQFETPLDVLNFLVVQGRNITDGGDVETAIRGTMDALETLSPLELILTIDSVMDLLRTLQDVLAKKLGVSI